MKESRLLALSEEDRQVTSPSLTRAHVPSSGIGVPSGMSIEFECPDPMEVVSGVVLAIESTQRIVLGPCLHGGGVEGRKDFVGSVIRGSLQDPIGIGQIGGVGSLRFIVDDEGLDHFFRSPW